MELTRPLRDMCTGDSSSCKPYYTLTYMYLSSHVSLSLSSSGCAEFFGVRGGEEYLVSHYLFKK